MDRLAYIGSVKRTPPGRIGKVWTITADSTPILDGWGWDDYWGCAEFKNWHASNVKKYGVEAANDKFMVAWGAQGFGAKPKILCGNTPSFVKYMSDYGINFNSVYATFVKGYKNAEELVVITKAKGTDAANTVNNYAMLGTLAIGTLVFYLGYQLLKPSNISNTTSAAAKFL